MDLHRMNYLCDLIRHIDIGITSITLFIQTFQTYRIRGFTNFITPMNFSLWCYGHWIKISNAVEIINKQCIGKYTKNIVKIYKYIFK